ncbi:MAG: response regulator, partial [Limisphaerales bacterium]
MAVEPIQILHIEDNPHEAALMRELVSVSLPDNHELTGVSKMAEALEHLANSRVDLILADLSLPDVSGMKTIHSLTPASPGIPIIILSGYDDEKTSLDALRAGASDYLVKGEVSSHLLRHAIRYAIERKRLDAALSIERDLVDNLLENTPDRIYFKDLNSRFLRINRTMAAVIGIEDPLDAVGSSDHDYFTAEHADSALESEQTVISTGQPLIGHIEHERTPDGREHWVLTSKMPLMSATGEIVGTFGISRDITEIKDAEQKLEHALSRNRLLAENLKRLASLTADEVESVLPQDGDAESRAPLR